MAFKSSRYDETSLEISVKKEDLLVILKRNREQHQKDFEKSIYFWQKHLAAVLSKIKPTECLEFPEELENARSHCPESCVKEYDDVIDMFEMSINETIILTTDAYRKYCKDEWDWKTSTYKNWYYKNLQRLEAEEKKEVESNATETEE